MPWPSAQSTSQWTYTRLDCANNLHPEVFEQCHRQLQYLRDLRKGWEVLVSPHSWTERPQKYPRLALYDTFNSFAGRLGLKFIEDRLTKIHDSDLEARSPYGNPPTFHLSSDRYDPTHQARHHFVTCTKSSMSLAQVAHILEFEGHGFYAESAIAMALDGIPSTIVRKKDLRLSQVRKSDCTDEEVMLDSLELLDADLALVYTPLGASQWVSVRRFRRLPVSPVNPALVLCARRTATSKQHSQDDLNLDVDIRRLAAAAERSLLSLRAISARRAHFVADSVKNHFLWTPDGEGNVLTPWAMLIGIIYDPESIHFVAYIPCNGGTDHHPQSHYLSVHFESLPFPAHSSAEVDQQFLCDRYRVAIALLCLQQHAYRLTSLWEDVQQTKEEYEIYADHIRSLDEEGERGTPTPSELYSGEEPVSDDYLVIDYDEDVDGENPEVPYDLIEKWRDTIEDDIESDSGLGFDNDDSDTSHKGEDSTMVYV